MNMSKHIKWYPTFFFGYETYRWNSKNITTQKIFKKSKKFSNFRLTFCPTVCIIYNCG